MDELVAQVVRLLPDLLNLVPYFLYIRLNLLDVVSYLEGRRLQLDLLDVLLQLLYVAVILLILLLSPNQTRYQLTVVFPDLGVTAD